MPITLGTIPVLTPKYRHTGWDATTNKALGRPEEPIRVGKWWYLPGNYNRVEDVDGVEYTRTNLTRFSGLASDAYSLDTGWQPDPDGKTFGLASDGTLVTVVGAFDNIAGAVRHKVAQFTAATGAITTFFNGLACNGTVQSVAIDGSGNYWFGGDFTSIAGSTRTRLAVLNPAGTVQALNVACTQSVIDLKWDPVNSRMLVLMDNDGTIGGGATCKVAAVTTGGTVSWRNNPNAGTFSFQLDCDQTYAYVATNGDNRTFQYLLTTGAAGSFTFWSTDGNNQGVTSYNGNVFIGHHGDATAIVKDSTVHPIDASHKSKGIVAISVAGAIQTWRPQFLQNATDAFGGGVLKVFRIGKDEVNNQVCFTGDFTKVTSLDGTQNVNARRVALFVDASAPPPPPPPPSGATKIIAAGDFTVGAGGLAREGTLVGTYFNAGDTVAMLAVGDNAYQEGTLAEFNANLNPVMGTYMKKFGRDWWYPVPGSHDYGTWGTSGAGITSVGITGYESYFRTAKALNTGAVGRYYRADDVLAPDGSATNWVIVRVNGVKAQTGFAQTEAGVNDGLIVPLAAGSPQNDFLKTTLAGIRDAGKCAIVVVCHPRYTSPSTGNHTSETRINPLWVLLDQYLPGRAIVFSAHQHNYERFFPQKAGGVRDNTNGNVQFVVGTGGGAAYVRDSALANSAAYQDTTNGVLELTLFDDHADFAWRKVTGETSSFTDAGTITMNVTAPPPPPPPQGVTASGKGAAGSTVAVTKPANVVTGSVLVASISLTGADSLTTIPTGFTLVPSSASGVGSGTTTKVWHALYKKTAGGAEPATYSWSGPATADSIFVNIVNLPSGSNVGTPSIVKSASTSAQDIVGTGGDVTGLTAGDNVLVFNASDWGPRPWANSGTLLGFMPNESIGQPLSDAAVTRLEGLIGREIAVGHSKYPQPGVDLAVQTTFPEPPGSATGVTSDWEAGRMSYISWPRQEAWLSTGGDQTPNRDPHIDFKEIVDGLHDAKIIAWANKLKTWGQPTWFRAFSEMNGGDPPWAVGYETSANVGLWSTNFKNAWTRIHTLMKGTQVEYDNLSPAAPAGTAPHVENIYFSWNPQEFESSANSAFSRDNHWPGDAVVEFAATELYLSPGDTAPEKMTNLGGGGFGGIAHKALYAEYAGVRGKRLATGEGGNRWQGSADTAAAITRTDSMTTMFKNYPAHAVFCWWDGGSTTAMGQSALAGKPQNLRDSENAFFNDAIMKPELIVTLQPQLGGFSVLTEGRAPVGKALTNYGPAQLSGTVLLKTATASTMTAANVKGYGYGRYVTTTLPIGTGSVVVTNPPTITSFSPTSGPIGTLITITGTNLLTVDTITYSPGITGAHTQISDTQMTSNVVSGATSGTFSIHNPDGTATSATPFTVTVPPPPPPAPTITSFTPGSGAVGSIVTITGSSFTTATSVGFTSNRAAFFTIVSDTQIQATVPAGAVTGTFTVTNPQGTGTSPQSFTVTLLPPTISSFTPTTGPVGTQVTLTGTNYTNATVVRFNGTSASFSISSDTQIITNVPTGATTGTIQVVNPDGTGTSGSSFTVTVPPPPPSAPTVTSFSPASGAVGSSVAIIGTSFDVATRVRFNGIDALFAIVDATHITATVPAATSGTISVTNPTGTGTSATSFTVTLNPPIITSFSPTSGSPGTQVAITGSKFTGVTAVKFFNNVTASFTVNSDTQIQTNVPATAATGVISVTNPDGTTNSSTSFTVSAPSAPTVSSFTPTSGPPGIAVDITGTNFLNVTGVKFGAIVASFLVISDTQIRATVPPGASTSNIVVTNAIGSANSPTTFAVTAGAAEFYWRVRVRDAAGNQSPWSDTAHVFVLAKGSLTINSPTTTVEDTTPLISTTLGGRAQAAISYTLEEQQPSGTYDEVWHQRRMKAPVAANTAFEFAVPRLDMHPSISGGKKRSPIRKRNTNYRLTVRSWDTNTDRVATPGVPIYSETQRIFQWQGAAGAPAPTVGLTATAQDGGVVIEWSRSAVPAYWHLLVDDEVASDRVDALDWQLGGTAYKVTFYGASPQVPHTYEVVAITEAGGTRHSSTNNPTAVATTRPIGIWLADSDISSTLVPANVIQLLGQPDSPAQIGESSETFYPVGRRDPITIRESVRGYEDTIDGAFVQSAADLEIFEALKGETGASVRLIMGDLNIPVEIGQMSIGRMPTEIGLYPVSFEVVQQDEFSIPQRQRGD